MFTLHLTKSDIYVYIILANIHVCGFCIYFFIYIYTPKDFFALLVTHIFKGSNFTNYTNLSENTLSSIQLQIVVLNY